MTGSLFESELVSRSVFSPGTVDCQEPIVLAAVEPLTYKDGRLRDLDHKQLKRCELSVCRAKYATGTEAKKQTVDRLLAKDATRIDHGFVWAFCKEIREITLESLGVRAFRVVDDALDGYEAHAHLGYSEIEDQKSERQSARGNLYLLFVKRGYFPVWKGNPFQPEISDAPAEETGG